MHTPLEPQNCCSRAPAVGLGCEEAAARLAAAGPNRVERQPPPSVARIVAAACLSPFNFLIVAIAAVTLAPPNNDVKTFAMVMVRVACWAESSAQHVLCVAHCCLSPPHWVGSHLGYSDGKRLPAVAESPSFTTP